MKTITGCKGAARLNLYQCEMLVANGMISKAGKDYEHDEVIAQMYRLQATKTERGIKAMIQAQARIPDDEIPPPIPYDSYLSQEEIEEYGLNLPF
jgi:hypothetical protein